MPKLQLSLLTLIILSVFASAREPAGRLSGSFNVTVSGYPASPETIREGIQIHLRRNVSLQPGAELYLPPKKDFLLKSLAPGKQTTVFIPYRIKGFGYAPIDAVVTINLTNDVIAPLPSKRLFVSNNPEAIKYPGILFTADLEAKSAGRFLYYHRAQRQRYELSLVARNNTSQSSRLFMSKGNGGSDRDGLFAGHIATRRFLTNRLKQEGVLVELHPGESVELIRQTVKPFQIATGILELQSLSGEIECTLVAVHKDAGGESRFLKQQRRPQQSRGGIFNTAYEKQSFTFGRFQTEKIFRIGTNPKIIDVLSGDFLKGNYGVMYTIDLFLDNRQNRKTRWIDLVLISGGGLARGNFQIQDRLYETKLLKSRQDEALIKRIELFPNEFRRVSIQTMPQPGAFYPVSLLIKEVSE